MTKTTTSPAHLKILHGHCRACGHYGSGCTGLDALRMAATFREACDEHLAFLNDEMVAGMRGADEGDLDDHQAQIDHWAALRHECDTFIAKAEGRDSPHPLTG